MKEQLINGIFHGNCSYFYGNNIYKNFDLFDMDIYSNLFRTNTAQTAEYIILNDKVKILENTDSKLKCIVKDDKDYNVCIKFNKDDKYDLDDAQCDCDKFLKEGINCKHIYSSLQKKFCLNNADILDHQIESVSSEAIAINKSVFDFINDNKKKLWDDLQFDNYFKMQIMAQIINIKKTEEYKFIKYNNNKEKIAYLSKLLGNITSPASSLIDIKYRIKKYNLSNYYLENEVDKILDQIDVELNKIDKKCDKETKEKLRITNNKSLYIRIKYLIYEINKNDNNQYTGEIVSGIYDIEQNCSVNQSEEELNNTYNQLIKIMNNCINNKKVSRNINKTHTNNSILSMIKNMFLGLFDSSPRSNNYKNDSQNDFPDSELEEKMNNLSLEDWQKNLVRKGEYDPENFEEEDLEEDDYHYEDV